MSAKNLVPLRVGNSVFLVSLGAKKDILRIVSTFKTKDITLVNKPETNESSPIENKPEKKPVMKTPMKKKFSETKVKKTKRN